MAQVKAFAPKIIQFLAGEDLTAGECVALSGFSTTEDPTPGLDLTIPFPQVKKTKASGANATFIGVVLNDADSGDKVDVVVEGCVKAEMDASHDVNAGSPLSISDAAGRLSPLSASSLADTENICCFAAEAGEDDSTTAGEKVYVYIPPRRITGLGSMI